MTFKSKIFFGIIIIAVLILFEIISRPSYPQFFDEELERYRTNEEIIESIGDYKGFEYDYNKNQLENGPLDYQITIYGSNGKVVIKGKALKNSTEWRIVEQTIEK